MGSCLSNMGSCLDKKTKEKDIKKDETIIVADIFNVQKVLPVAYLRYNTKHYFQPISENTPLL